MDELENLENVNEGLHMDAENLDTGADSSVDSETNGEAAPESADDGAGDSTDYAALVREDVLALKAEFPELANLGNITELDNPLRYAALRDLGLSAAEAYLATTKRQRRDNRSHLYATRAISTSEKGVMPESELASAREIFVGVSDAQIKKLYKRVTK